MSKWARINDGRVAEITNIDPAGRFHPSIQWVAFDGRKSVSVGWAYDGSKFSEPTPEPDQTIEDWRKNASVTSRQGEQQLIIADLYEKVDAAIEAITDTMQRKLIRAWYNRAATWERNNPEFIALGEALGLTPEQMDEQIKEAAKL